SSSTRSSKFGTAGVDFEVSIYDTGLSNSKQSVIGIHHCSCSYSVVRAICNIFVLGCGNPDNGANRLSVVHAKVDISREIRELDPIDLNKIHSSHISLFMWKSSFALKGAPSPNVSRSSSVFQRTANVLLALIFTCLIVPTSPIVFSR
uniref:BTB domain-containing protein n=1 Tax=Parascaris univalens TaxID=6257 RepID=A0A915BYT6_PARUN